MHDHFRPYLASYYLNTDIYSCGKYCSEHKHGPKAFYDEEKRFFFFFLFILAERFKHLG